MPEARSRGQRIADTQRRLSDDTDAWVASASGREPWLVPLSFLWHNEKLVFATDASTPTGKNVGAIPWVRVALGHTRDVVLVHGRASITSCADLTAEEASLYRAKHGSDPRTWADSIIRATPTRIQAWREENELKGRLVMREGNWLQ